MKTFKFHELSPTARQVAECLLLDEDIYGSYQGGNGFTRAEALKTILETDFNFYEDGTISLN